MKLSGGWLAFGNLLESGVVHMKVRFLRSVVSAALSCWFGFLACLLGCAQPTLAATHCDPAQPSGLNSDSANSNTRDSSPCCNHGRNPSDGQRENRHSSASCCPLNATLIQKHDSVSPSSNRTDVPVPVSVTLYFPNPLIALSELPLRTIWYAGRDILLQAHILRI